MLNLGDRPEEVLFERVEEIKAVLDTVSWQVIERIIDDGWWPVYTKLPSCVSPEQRSSLNELGVIHGCVAFACQVKARRALGTVGLGFALVREEDPYRQKVKQVLRWIVPEALPLLALEDQPRSVPPEDDADDLRGCDADGPEAQDVSDKHWEDPASLSRSESHQETRAAGLAQQAPAPVQTTAGPAPAPPRVPPPKHLLPPKPSASKAKPSSQKPEAVSKAKPYSQKPEAEAPAPAPAPSSPQRRQKPRKPQMPPKAMAKSGMAQAAARYEALTHRSLGPKRPLAAGRKRAG